MFLKGVYWDPFFFLLYINDLPNVTSPSTSTVMFADHAKCYRVVRNAEDCSSLQRDLSSVYAWSKDWSLHISSVVVNANKTLGFLNRQFSFSFIGPSHRKSLYLTLVRSLLSYVNEIWAPQSCRRDMRLLESVQRRATRFIMIHCFYVGQTEHLRSS